MLWSERLWVPSNSCVEILTPEMMVLEDGTFGRYLGPEGRTLMTGTSTLLKEAPERALAPSVV